MNLLLSFLLAALLFFPCGISYGQGLEGKRIILDGRTVLDINTLSKQKKFRYLEGGHLLNDFSFSPDSMYFIFKIWHAGDAISYGVIDVKNYRFRLLGNEPSRIVWSRKSDKVCVLETQLSGRSSIKIFKHDPRIILRLVKLRNLGDRIPRDIFWENDSLLVVSPYFQISVK